VLKRLVAWEDVVVTNFSSRCKAFGLAYEELAALKPELIYADITG
jgi:crotonobetainyl-CoA:carnitine CoA-transferase CaiB-like acyl-CoA transferase